MMMFLEILTEIVEKIEIDPHFAVRHPDYPPLELPSPDAIARFQRLPPQLQEKYSIIQIQTYLYELYFSHSLQEIAATAQQQTQIKNNLIDGVDIDFYQRLERSNTSRGYFDPDWQIVATTERGEAIAVKDGLHLHIDPQRHLATDCRAAAIGDVVPIYLPHNLVDRDSYIAVGNCGRPNSPQSIELYFNFTPDAAVAIVQTLTISLNQLRIPFQFAILHDPALFYRYDTGRLWLAQTDYLAAQPVLTEIYSAHQADFSPHVPLFSKQLAPGLGIAEVQTTAGKFGMQRCEILAQGLLAAMAQPGSTTSADKLRIICQEFTTAGIDWQQPYLNPNSVDCYSIYEVK